MRLCFLGGAAFCLLLAACSSPANRQAMTPQSIAISKHYPHSLQVQTIGGAETSGLDSTNIANDDLKAAIEDAIVQSRLFAKVQQGPKSDYLLNVQIVSLHRPLIGGTLTVELETGWSLVRRADQVVVMRQAINTTGSASIGDAFAFVTRLRLAIEMAARDSIKQGIKAIAELNL